MRSERLDWLRRQVEFRKAHITFLYEEIEVMEREIQREEYGMFPLRVPADNVRIYQERWERV
jgi:hypothetical protein